MVIIFLSCNDITVPLIDLKNKLNGLKKKGEINSLVEKVIMISFDVGFESGSGKSEHNEKECIITEIKNFKEDD